MGKKEYYEDDKGNWGKVHYKDDGKIDIFVGVKDSKGHHDHFIYNSKTGEREYTGHRGYCDDCSKKSGK